jgi:alkanesulfonate monooxygenase SsuD/methylene tetrahydromethanopterin reductase-like flavin-dependent oxidoreductase (luciferase family)
MDFGLVLPTMPRGATVEGIEAAAEAALRFGWSTVWATDHIIPGRGPLGDEEEYAYIFEAITTLSYIGGRYPGLRIGTSAICVPMRNNSPLLAKELASLDALTQGRLTVALGIGDEEDRPEYANLGSIERFRQRGAYLEETIHLWRHLWAGKRNPFEGRFHHLADFAFGPLPAQGERLPIWTGGRSEAAYRRAGRISDGYHASQTGPEDLRPRLPIILKEAEEAGRPVPTLSIRARLKPGKHRGPVYALCGAPQDMLADLCAFEDMGVQHIAILLEGNTPEKVTVAAEWFASEVIAGLDQPKQQDDDHETV